MCPVRLISFFSSRQGFDETIIKTQEEIIGVASLPLLFRLYRSLTLAMYAAWNRIPFASPSCTNEDERKVQNHNFIILLFYCSIVLLFILIIPRLFTRISSFYTSFYASHIPKI